MSSEANSSKKQQIWAKLTHRADNIIDRLGEPIDEAIKETVVALHAHGFGTTASCEGHVDRALPYPWIDVVSLMAAKHNMFKSRFMELEALARAARQGGELLSEADASERQAMIEEVSAKNLKAQGRLQELLNQYDEHQGYESPALVIWQRPRNRSQLVPSDVPEGSLKVVRAKLEDLSIDDLEKALKLKQAEMLKFATFLKDKFMNA